MTGGLPKQPGRWLVVGLLALLLGTRRLVSCLPADEHMCQDASRRQHRIFQNCPELDRPVCGCNNHTYRNVCEAEKAGITLARPGDCDCDCVDSTRRNLAVVCEPVAEPVCGCDERTYANACEALRPGVLVFTPGRCDSSRMATVQPATQAPL